MEQQHTGRIAIIGRPNVGKSTFLNHLLGQKISITCRKPQTTRHQILGIKTLENAQFIFVDTPGMHQNNKAALNRYLNRAAFTALHDVDVVLWLIEPQWTVDEDWIFERLNTLEKPVILAINKADLVKDKTTLLPLIEHLSQKERFAAIVPLSAKTGEGEENLLKLIQPHLPAAEFEYEIDEITNKSVKFLVAEIVREKLMRFLGDELPYATTVEIEAFKETEVLADIAAMIYVERPTQKAIVIGEKGKKLKEIGTEARLDIQRLLEKKVMLRLWVKVKENWRDDERSLMSLGYGGEA